MPLLLLSMALGSASVAPCPRPVLSPAIRRTEAASVSRATGHHTGGRQVSYLLTADEWKLVWAEPDQQERGVFFFRRAGLGWRLVDTWGGVIAPDERAATERWAQRRGVPPRLARCFVDALLAGR